MAYAENYNGSIAKGTDFITIVQAKAASYTLSYKNTGNATWKKGQVYLETGDFLKSFSMLQHSSWQNHYRVVGLSQDVKPGETAKITFYLAGPASVVGEIQQNLQLVVNGTQPIRGTTLRLFASIAKASSVAKTASNNTTVSTPNKAISSPVANTAVAAQAVPVVSTATGFKANTAGFCSAATGALTSEQISQYANCNTAANESGNGSGQSAINSGDRSEPMMRIGLFSTTLAQRVSNVSITDVYAESVPLYSGIRAGDAITLGFDFKTKTYSASVQGMTKFSLKPLRVVPRTKNSPATLLDYRNGAVGSGTSRDNQFRNIIEMQYSAKTGKLWLINELPLGYYMKGLGETSNASPVEFQKVMLSAARTYAMYHYNRGVDFKVKDGSTKHADEHFHLDATYDQVYRGYVSELRIPTLVRAEDETRGMIITYQGKVAITPYFSRSDGRTRSYQEVWGGTGMPWLVSVAVPQDSGQSLWGHGVGMSARGALLMVVNEKKSWDTVIRYFYQGVSIQKIY